MNKTWKAFLGTLVATCVGGVASAQAPMGVQPAQPAVAPAQPAQPATNNQQVMTFSSNPGCSAPTCPADDCCEGPGGALEAGVSLYYLKPRWTSNPSQIAVANAGGTPVSIVQENFAYPMSASPAIWVGYTGEEGMGARIRWFRFDQNSTRSFTNGAPPVLAFSAEPLGLFTSSTNTGDFSQAYSSLRLETWDLEATGTSGDEQTLMQAGIGVRFAHLAQRYDAGVFSPELGSSGLFSGHNFNGGGPMVSGQYHRRIGDSGLGVFALGRGSLLWGNRKDNAYLLNGNTLTVSSNTTGDTLLPTVELELGVEYTRDVGDAQVFAQLGGVGQVYFNAGNSSNNNLFGIPAGIPTGDSNLGLFGLVLSAGVRY